MTEDTPDFGKPVAVGRYDKAFRPLPGSTPVSLVDLERGQCKWPVGENPIVMCGLPACDDRYCSTHAEMSRGKTE